MTGYVTWSSLSKEVPVYEEIIYVYIITAEVDENWSYKYKVGQVWPPQPLRLRRSCCTYICYQPTGQWACLPAQRAINVAGLAACARPQMLCILLVHSVYITHHTFCSTVVCANYYHNIIGKMSRTLQMLLLSVVILTCTADDGESLK